MCFKITCTTCGKATWAGCGMHIESALRGVKPEDRCCCQKHSQQTTAHSSHKPSLDLWSTYMNKKQGKISGPL